MNYERGGIAFVGCIVLGIGLGMIFDKEGAGMMIGLGVGFLAMAALGKKDGGSKEE